MKGNSQISISSFIAEKLIVIYEHFIFFSGEVSNNSTQNLSTNNSNNNNTVNIQQQNSGVAIITKDEHDQQNATPIQQNENNTTSVITGSHQCDLCLKSFQFRYQLIVHRRYHSEKKPFTCQVMTLELVCVFIKLINNFRFAEKRSKTAKNCPDTVSVIWEVACLPAQYAFTFSPMRLHWRGT